MIERITHRNQPQYRLYGEKFVVCSVCLDSSVVRVMARYARDPGFDSRLRHDFSSHVSFIYL